MKKILILGATGMLGHKLLTNLSKNPLFEVWATSRTDKNLQKWFGNNLKKKIISGIDADLFDSFEKQIIAINPDIVINCIGIIKQLPIADDPVVSISINALLPHKIANICKKMNARMIHISTDCVFDGKKGNYKEKDLSDAYDLYGKSKYLGEVHYPHAITLRTSIIGHELETHYGLVEWFLSQKEKVKGFKKAIFTGFPTVEIAEIIEKYIIPNESLIGLYQVSSNPISKYDLLNLIAEIYQKNIIIQPDESVFIDRSLDSSLFREKTGYQPPSWELLVQKMYHDYKNSSQEK